MAPGAIASNESIRAVHDLFGVFPSERVLALAQATAPRDGEVKPSSGPDDSADEMLPKRMQCLCTADSAAEKRARAVSLEKLAVAQVAAAAADSRRRFFLGDGSDDGNDSDGDDEVASYTMGGGAAGISGTGGASDSAAAADAVLLVPVPLTSSAASLPAPVVQAQPTALVETAAQPTLAVDLRSTDGAQETHQQPPGATGDTPSEIEV